MFLTLGCYENPPSWFELDIGVAYSPNYLMGFIMSLRLAYSDDLSNIISELFIYRLFKNEFLRFRPSASYCRPSISGFLMMLFLMAL